MLRSQGPLSPAPPPCGILCAGAVGLVCPAFPSFTAYVSPSPDVTAIPPDS